MTFDQFIPLAALCAAALSAFATFLTVRQISKQRQASYRPELTFSRATFSVQRRAGQNSGPPSEWGPIDAPDVAVEPPRGDDGFSLSLVNIGLGSAKQVRIDWNFPIERVIAEVNHLAQKSLSGTFLELKDGLLHTKSASGGGSISNWKVQQSTELDYVLPVSIASTGQLVLLPHAYLDLVVMLAHFALVAEDDIRMDTMPPLTAKISYSDIGEKRFTVAFDITVHYFHIVGKGERMSGYFTCKRAQPPTPLLNFAAEVAAKALESSSISIGIGPLLPTKKNRQ